MLLGKRKVSTIQEDRRICDSCWMNPRLATRERLWYCDGRRPACQYDRDPRESRTSRQVMKDYEDRVSQWAARMEAEAPDCVCLREFLYLMAEGRA